MWYKNCLNKFVCINCAIIRRKHKDTHWSVIAKKKTAKDKALLHFDELYKSIYGSEWPSIRLALLSQQKYCAVVNNFSDSEETISALKKLGAVDIREVFKAELKYQENEEILIKDSRKKLSARKEKLSDSFSTNQLPGPLYDVSSKDTVSQGFQDSETDSSGKRLHENANAASLRSQLSQSELEYDRIVKPDLSGAVSASALHEFVPATKLKGMEDWVLESEHYSGYQESMDFPIVKKKEDTLFYPKYWNIFSYIRGDVSRYPHPSRGKAGVYNYYLLDAASILPVLALDITNGDRVLDMCAGPGGKSFLILQTLYPERLVSNDVQGSRVGRIKGVMDDYFFKLKNWSNNMSVSHRDGRVIDEENTFNKILVDVPCTTDRHAVLENDNNIFSPARVKERIRLPQLQTELLCNAMKIVRPGGTVVYSTCSLSPVQNDGVVHMALKRIWEETKIEMEVRDMKNALKATRNVFKFSTSQGLRYGHLVLPFLPNNFGPSYFSSILP
ncbi:5-methylcytosine rRNA methyltransferase NSUN4 isoform X2 [Ischnura elegans]|uniref:5-methylcytosine rRNA methyltransferase NSUN4 isoform X2 n=1 Tax=Ischnura elegans TaxID=197161 RepID=UPI001ED895AD|nr:5-methylcytosine rRNA methyltransferase NSUN4 isoform X2 [Ischnura elegans]